jgi:hypothetical protein
VSIIDFLGRDHGRNRDGLALRRPSSYRAKALWHLEVSKVQHAPSVGNPTREREFR